MPATEATSSIRNMLTSNCSTAFTLAAAREAHLSAPGGGCRLLPKARGLSKACWLTKARRLPKARALAKRWAGPCR